MKKIYFILHGSFGASSGNWFPWLHDVLASKGHRCFVPAFPTPEDQTFNNWASILDAYNKIGLMNEQTILVAHSSAAAFAIKYAISRNLHCTQLVTVAGFNQFLSGDENFDKINTELFVSPQELGQAESHFNNIDSFFSSSDPYLPLTVLQNFASEIKSTIHQVDNAGHFNSESGYKSFEAILSIMK